MEDEKKRTFKIFEKLFAIKFYENVIEKTNSTIVGVYIYDEREKRGEGAKGYNNIAHELWCCIFILFIFLDRDLV